MDISQARKIFDSFLDKKQEETEFELLIVEDAVEQKRFGWVFYYQSAAYLESQHFRDMLAGHGPVIVLENGKILEGGSIDRNAEAVFKRLAP